MKKVLLISYENIYAFGGQENYNYELAKIFIDLGWEVHYFGLYERQNIHKINDEININITIPYKINAKNLSFIKMLKMNKKGIKKLCEYLKANKFDLIIDSLLFTNRKYSKVTKNLNRIWIQHQTKGILDYSAIIKYPFSTIIYNLWKLLSGFYANVVSCNQAVFYTKTDSVAITKRFKLKLKNNWEIPLFSDLNYKRIPLNEKIKNLIWFGRVDNKQKRINYLVKLSKYLNCDIHVYGEGNNNNKLKNNPNRIVHMGKFKQENKNEIISKYLLNISTSRFEGFSFSAAESLCNGVPIIIPNSFDSAQWLINNGKNGLLYNKKFSPKKLAKLINNFIENIDEKIYINYCNNCFQFAKDKLTKEIFDENWKKIIQKF